MFFASDYFISIPFCVIIMSVAQKKDRNPHRPKLVSLSSHTMADGSATDRDMITVITEECNEISQELYDALMDPIQTCQLTCSCGRRGCLVGHGRYNRSVKTPMGKTSIAIRRVRCGLCRATHALLPSTIVPYSQVPLTDHAAIASSYESGGNAMDVMEADPELSPSQVFYILSLYIRFWRQRILGERLKLTPAHALTQPCLRLFGRQFMQIKSTRNVLFVLPT